MKKKDKVIKVLKPPSPTLNLDKTWKILLEQLKAGELLLDIGSKERRLSPQAVNIDLFSYPNVNAVADAHRLPFKEGVFNAVYIHAVLELTKNPMQVINEIYRVLKKGGLVHCQMPFIQGYTSDPKDYHRCTIDGLKEVFNKFKEEDCGICCGPSSGVVWILREYFAVFWNNDFMYNFTKFAFGWLLFPLKYLDTILARKKRAHTISSAFYYIGRK